MSDPLIDLADSTKGLVVYFPKPLKPASQRLMDALGVVVRIDPLGILTEGCS